MKGTYSQLRSPQSLKFLIGNDALLLTMPSVWRFIDKKGQLKKLIGVVNDWGQFAKLHTPFYLHGYPLDVGLQASVQSFVINIIRTHDRGHGLHAPQLIPSTLHRVSAKMFVKFSKQDLLMPQNTNA